MAPMSRKLCFVVGYILGVSVLYFSGKVPVPDSFAGSRNLYSFLRCNGKDEIDSGRCDKVVGDKISILATKQNVCAACSEALQCFSYLLEHPYVPCLENLTFPAPSRELLVQQQSKYFRTAPVLHNKTERRDLHGWKDYFGGKSLHDRAEQLVLHEFTNVYLDESGMLYDQQHAYEVSARVPASAVRHEIVYIKRATEVMSIFGTSYGHFVPEVVPLLVFIRPHLLADPDRKLILRRGSRDSSFVRAFLDLMGIPLDRIIEGSAKLKTATRAFHVESLHRARYHRFSSWVHPRESLGAAHQFFVPNDIPLTQRTKIVFYSRRPRSHQFREHGDSRVVATDDEDAIVAALRARHPQNEVKLIVPDDFSLPQIVELFSSARIVIGPHGAGMANILFCAPGTSVIEFIGSVQSSSQRHWYLTAQGLQLDYHMVVLHGYAWRDSTWRVPVDLVVEAVDSILART